MTLGFLGTGAITSAIVTGLNSPGGPGPTIHVSPRSAPVAAALATRFPNVSIAASNQQVLDTSGTVSSSPSVLRSPNRSYHNFTSLPTTLSSA